MTAFKQPDLLERQEAATKAKKAALEKFRAKAADPALADRLTARTARADERRAVNTIRKIEKADKKARDAELEKQAERDAAIEAEREQQAERDAAIQAERAEAESADRERALDTERKAARDARYAARKSRLKRR
jgi:hypothetical protein